MTGTTARLGTYGHRGRRLLPKTKKLLDSYMAGIVDGEGAISLLCGSSGYYQCRLSVSNTCQELLEQVHLTYGGSEVRFVKGSEKHRQCYVWYVNGQAALPVLKLLLPFLIVKREHAKLAITFLETCAPGTGRRLSEAQFDESERLAQEMRKHNMKGPQ